MPSFRETATLEFSKLLVEGALYEPGIANALETLGKSAGVDVMTAAHALALKHADVMIDLLGKIEPGSIPDDYKADDDT